jgi:hypothetical protein
MDWIAGSPVLLSNRWLHDRVLGIRSFRGPLVTRCLKHAGDLQAEDGPVRSALGFVNRPTAEREEPRILGAVPSENSCRAGRHGRRPSFECGLLGSANPAGHYRYACGPQPSQQSTERAIDRIDRGSPTELADLDIWAPIRTGIPALAFPSPSSSQGRRMACSAISADTAWSSLINCRSR